ncbi:MAG: glycosyltransferase family 4 protein [Alcanivoracaceae bacterium]|nr:glycosyltransferase family 4 protein [Alcanivoracaceae bacterium]
MTDRILYHHRTRGRNVEGVHIRAVAGALRGLGYRVDILSMPGADPEAPDAVPGEQPVRPSWASRLLSSFAARSPEFVFELAELAYNLLVWWRVGGAIRRQKPRWIYERYSLFMFATVLLARRRRIPLVLEVNDSATRPRVRPLLFRRLATRIEHWVFNRCDGLVFVSSAFRDQVLDAHGSLSRTIISPNAADISRFDPQRHDGHAIRESLGLSGKRVCGYLGAFIEWHGIHRFVEAIAPRLASMPDFRLLLVGDGRMRAAVEQCLQAHGVEGQAVLTGNVPHEQVPAYLAAMDFSVLPDSNTYGSPMKLFELMAMGVPVVAPAYGPIAEVMEDGETGWLFRPGDMDQCLQIVCQLDADAIVRVGDNARRYIHEHRQWRNNAEQLVALFARVEQQQEQQR